MKTVYVIDIHSSMIILLQSLRHVIIKQFTLENTGGRRNTCQESSVYIAATLWGLASLLQVHVFVGTDYPQSLIRLKIPVYKLFAYMKTCATTQFQIVTFPIENIQLPDRIVSSSVNNPSFCCIRKKRQKPSYVMETEGF